MQFYWTVTVNSNNNVRVHSGNIATLDSNNNVPIESNLNVTIKSNNIITAKSGNIVTVNSNNDVTIQSNNNVTVSCNNNMTVDSGNIVIVDSNNNVTFHTTNSETVHSLNVVTADSNNSVAVDNNNNVTVGSNINVTTDTFASDKQDGCDIETFGNRWRRFVWVCGASPMWLTRCVFNYSLTQFDGIRRWASCLYSYRPHCSSRTCTHLHLDSGIQGWEIDKYNDFKKINKTCSLNEACESGRQWGCLALINFFPSGSSTHVECCSSTQRDFSRLCLPESDSCP